MKQMVSELNNSNNFDWEIEVKKGKPSEILYVLGMPKEN